MCQLTSGWSVTREYGKLRPARLATEATFMSDTKTVNLEKALADLEKLVEDLESGDLPLEKAMKKFEDGIKLTRSCQSALKDAEQKVQVLIRSAGGDESLEDFEGDD